MHVLIPADGTRSDKGAGFNYNNYQESMKNGYDIIRSIQVCLFIVLH